MTSKILSLLALDKVLPSSSIIKGISKSSPFLKKFFANSENAGIGRGAAVGFLTSKFGGKKVIPEEGERPEETSERMAKKERELPIRLAKEGAQIGGLAALGGLLSGESSQEPEQQIETPEQQEAQQPISQEEQAQEELGTERQAATALGEITSLEDLARIDRAVAQKVGEGLQRGLTAHDIDASLKRSRILGPRTMMVERKLGKPIAWIIDYISNRPQEDRQQGTIGQTDNLIQSALDLLGR